MPEHSLFSAPGEAAPIEVFLGEHDCDVPFGEGGTRRVAVSLTTDSPRSKHGIPVLRLQGGHRLDFAAHEQTPAGHAALLVARWLEQARPEGAARRAAELFLWQWPGIEPNEQGRWRLTNEAERRKRFSPPFADASGRLLDAGDAPADTVLDSLNLQVVPYGFCRKSGPCYLLDGCLLCPHFVTSIACLPAIEARLPELEAKRRQALESNNQRLAEACQKAVRAIDRIRRAFKSISAAPTQGENS